MSIPPAKITCVKDIKSVKLESNVTSDKVDRNEQIKRKKLINNSYPFEEHGL